MSKRYDSTKVSKALGLRIRELRLARGWTLEECESAGYPSWRHLQKVEAGKMINLSTLVNLANLFGISLSRLVEGI